MVRPIVFGCVLFWLNIHGYVSQALPAELVPEPDLKFMAFLSLYENGVYVIICSGTVIHERFVLTAADCFYTNTGEPISYQHKVLIASDFKDIENLIPYPRYFLQTWENNVGLIKLAEKVVFGPSVRRMSLAHTEDLYVNAVAYTTCWVMREKKNSLQEESVRVAPRRHCGRPPFYGRYITTNMTCTIASYNYTVNSGAPLLKDGQQHGVASRQFGRQVVFTNIYRLRWWIANIVFNGHVWAFYSDMF